MKDEHFGISIVELMAAGLVPIAHDSAGPKFDIVRPWKGEKTGFLATTVDEFANALDYLFKNPTETDRIRHNARDSVNRFSDEEFANVTLKRLEELIGKGDRKSV